MEELKETIKEEQKTLNTTFIDEKQESHTDKNLPDGKMKSLQNASFIEAQKNSPEAILGAPSESVEVQIHSESSEINSSDETIDIKTEDANTTNCLALTIKEDHRIIAIKNVFLRSVRMSWKVVVSTITLALIKLFS